MILINGDCLQALEKLNNLGIKANAVITSPPYNACLRVHNGKYCSMYGWATNEKHFLSKYGDYTDDLKMEDYFKFIEEFVVKSLVLTDLLFVNIQMITGNKVALCQLLGRFADKVKEVIIWNKVNAQPAMNEGVLNSQYEFIIVFQNSKPYNRTFDYCNFKRGTETNVWSIKKERNPYIKAGFPQELVRRIINDFVEPNGLIIDPFMGSGTTGLVCGQMGYEFIGVELEKKRFDICVERLKQYKPEITEI